MNVTLSFSGVKEIDDMLKELPKTTTHRLLGSVHAAAAKPLIRAAYFGVQLKSGRLAESIGAIKLSVRKAKQIGVVRVGPIRQKGRRYGNHGHLIEYGHILVGHKPDKRILGKVRPFPFMRPAFEKTKHQVAENIKVELVKRMIALMKRTLKK